MDLLFGVCVILVSLISLIFIYFKYSYSYFERKKIKFLEPSFPFGNFKRLILGEISIGEIYKEIYNKIANSQAAAIGVYQFHQPVLILKDPELIKQCLVRNFGHFQDRGFRINEENDPLCGHLFFIGGMKWKNLRTKLSPTFTSGRIKAMFNILETKTEKLIDFLNKKQNNVVEVKEIFARLLTDIIASCAFGIETNTLENPNDDFREWGRKTLEPSLRTSIGLFLITCGKFASKLAVWKLIDAKVSNYFIEMVKETIEFREKEGIKKNDFMNMLIQLKNNQRISLADGDEEDEFKEYQMDDGKSLTQVECAAQAFVFFLAGFETSSTTMSYAAYELAMNPEIQQKAHQEIDKASEFTYESLAQMTYLDKIIKETLRKYPPVPILDRVVTQPLTINAGINGEPVLLEEDLKMVIPVLGLHHDPKHFPEPDRFDPERFNEENKSKRHNYVYLPFGEGPRNCIGARFGALQTKVGLALLLKNFTFQVCEETTLKAKFEPRSFIHQIVGGIHLNIVPRKNHK